MKSQEHSYIGPRQVRALQITPANTKDYQALSKIGLNIREGDVRDMMRAMGLDSNDVGINPSALPGLTSPSITTPVQFLQAWLPGFTQVITAPRKIDQLVGITTVGAWEDEEVVQGVLEPLGTAVPYSDYGNVPLSSWNTNWERRTVVRFESGFQVGRLEEARAARMRVSSAAEKRNASSIALDIQRNRVGFYGYNDGTNRTFGYLNDPALPAYVTAPNGASGSPLWQDKTLLEIEADLRAGFSGIRINTKDFIDPKEVPITIALPTAVVDYITTSSDLGYSVQKWLDDNYPKARVISAPEMNDANGGASAMYMYAETVDDGASDNNRVFDQPVPSRFITLGVDKDSKSYIEDFSNATAGVMCKRPYAVFRMTGI